MPPGFVKQRYGTQGSRYFYKTCKQQLPNTDKEKIQSLLRFRIRNPLSILVAFHLLFDRIVGQNAKTCFLGCLAESSPRILPQSQPFPPGILHAVKEGPIIFCSRPVAESQQLELFLRKAQICKTLTVGNSSGGHGTQTQVPAFPFVFRSSCPSLPRGARVRHYPWDYANGRAEACVVSQMFPCPFPRIQHEGDSELKALADTLQERLLSPELMGLFKMMLPHMEPQEVSVFLVVYKYR